MQCEAVWLSDTEEHSAGSRCGAPARYLVRFDGVVMAVCVWHRAVVVEELKHKRVSYSVGPRAES